MKKLKTLSIAICCLVSFLWTEAQGMQHKDGDYHIVGKNRLSYNTILINTEDGVGTGFYYVRNDVDSKHQYNKIILDRTAGDLGNNTKLYIITNKHVVRKEGKINKQVLCDEIKGTFKFIKENKIENVELNIPKNNFKKHKSEDLCALDVSDIVANYEQQNGSKLMYYTYLENGFAPMNSTIELLSDIALIGYPEGFYDETNNLPISRRGVVASPVNIDWDGCKEFMIDCACFPGSSGSPVTWLKTETEIEDEAVTTTHLPYLAGVLSHVQTRDVTGKVKIPVPKGKKGKYGKSQVNLSLEMNIGYVIKSPEIENIFK